MMAEYSDIDDSYPGHGQASAAHEREKIGRIRSIWGKLHGGSADSIELLDIKHVDEFLITAALGRYHEIGLSGQSVSGQLDASLGGFRVEILLKILNLFREMPGEQEYLSPAQMHPLLRHGEDCLAFCEYLLKTKTLFLPSLWDTEPVACRGSVLFPSAANTPRVAYLFNDREPFYIFCAGFVSCQISGIYFPSRELFVHAGRPQPIPSSLADVRAFQCFLLRNASLLPDHFALSVEDRLPSICIHAYHFAHHLWNELSGLDGLLADGRQDLRVWVLNSPFGPFRQLFPELLESQVVERSNKSLEEIAAEGLASAAFWLPLGRLFISKDLIARLLMHARHEHPNDVEFSRKIRAEHNLVLWMTTRRDARVWVDQVDVMVGVIESLVSQYGKLAVIFDGHTPGYRGLVSGRTVDAEQSVIEVISKKARVDFTTISLIGADLRQALVWGGIADAYIANHGTLQHKIGWFHDLPGVCVHFPATGFAPELFSALYARQGATVPDYILGSVVERDGREGDKRSDLFSFKISAEELLSTLADKLPARDRKEGNVVSRICNVRGSFYTEQDADILIAEAQHAWRARNSKLALESFAGAVNVAPHYERAYRSLLGYVLMVFVSHFQGTQFAEARVGSLRLYLTAIDRNNAWCRERLLIETFELTDTATFERTLRELLAQFPDWKQQAISSLHYLTGRRGTDAIKLRTARSILLPVDDPNRL